MSDVKWKSKKRIVRIPIVNTVEMMGEGIENNSIENYYRKVAVFHVNFY